MPELVPGDIVSFPFPYRDGKSPYARPCLVLDANEEELLLAYGTSSHTRANSGHEIRVAHDYAVCGLDRPSRFVLTRRIRVRRDDARVESLARRGSLVPTLAGRITRLVTLLEQDFASAADRIEAERQGIHPARSRRTRKRKVASVIQDADRGPAT